MSRTKRRAAETRKIKPYILDVSRITGKHESIDHVIKYRYTGYVGKSCDDTFPSKSKRIHNERRRARHVLKQYDIKNYKDQ